MITNSNQECFMKMPGCGLQEGIFRNDIFEPNAEWLYGLR